MAVGIAPKPQLTPEQAAAIHAEDLSVALSAGAGCGKTFVLTERYLAQLARPGQDVELRELVAITYTERAAREMRERIRKKCLERVQAATTTDEAQRWWRFLRELDSARVSTIHSFCATLLRSHAVEAQLDPGFQVLDEATAGTLLNEITDDELRGWLAEQRPEVMDLVVQFNLDGLRNQLHVLLRSAPDLIETWATATPDEVLAAWQQFHEQTYLPQFVNDVAEGPATATVLRILRETTFPTGDKMCGRQAFLLEHLPTVKQTEDLGTLLPNLRMNAMLGNISNKAKEAFGPENYAAYRDAAEELRKAIADCAAVLKFDKEAARPSAVAGCRMLALARQVRTLYAARKQELSYLDFDDLIFHAHRLLTSPANKKLQQRIASGISLLLVDEFQDTDPIQVDLVKALCGDDLTSGKLFFVGDRKQSIYRFRGAAPQVFRQLQAEMRPDGRLPLTKNFRSQPAILNFVNYLFVERFQPEYEALSAHRPQQSPEPAVEFWWTKPDFGKRGTGGVNVARRHEAHWMAQRLSQLLTAGTPLIPDHASSAKGRPALRPLRAGDVCILFRALSNVQFYEQALQEFDIPYYLVGGHAFYAQQEIFDVLNLLRTLDCPADEVALAGALRSPFFALTDESLFWLAQHRQGLAAGLFAAQLPPELTTEQRTRVTFAAATLQTLRQEKDRRSITELLNLVIAQTGYDAILLAEFLGERKLANLRKLLDDARRMDQSGAFTLSDFVAHLSDAVAEQPKEALAATQPEAADVVRLMTIHQSKGLEFPFVIVADVDRPKRGSTTSALLHPTLGPLVRVKPALDDTKPVIGLDMHKALEEAEDDAEFDRLFYVATTRAADHLVLSGSFFNDKPTSRWVQLLADRFDLDTGEALATAGTGAAPAVHVSQQIVPDDPPSKVKSSKTDWTRVVEQAALLVDQQKEFVPATVAPLPPDRTARRQFSFSRLTGELHRDQPVDVPEQPARPRNDQALTLGTLVHAVLADLNFAEPQSLAELVARQADLLGEVDSATATVAQTVLTTFLKSARFQQLAAAQERHVEVEFLLAWPPGAADYAGPTLHGFIDCLYQDATGAWHVLDYKTNRVTAATVSQVAAQYELQLGVYALAAEAALGSAPHSLILHFLATGLEHPLTWDQAARERTIATITELLNRARGG